MAFLPNVAANVSVSSPPGNQIQLDVKIESFCEKNYCGKKRTKSQMLPVRSFSHKHYTEMASHLQPKMQVCV